MNDAANPTDSFHCGDRVILLSHGKDHRSGAIYTVTRINSASSLQVSFDGGKGRGWSLRGHKGVRVVSRREVGSLDSSRFNDAEKALIESIRCGREHVLEAPIRATVAHKIFRAYGINMPFAHLSDCAKTLHQARGENIRRAQESGADYWERRLLARQEMEEDHNLIGFA